MGAGDTHGHRVRRGRFGALTNITCDDGNSTGSTVTRTATYLVAAGETVKCTFTNQKDARIIVIKQTEPGGTIRPEFEFTADYDENGFSLSDNEQNDSGDLDPDTYSVAEVVPRAGSSCPRPATTRAARPRSASRPARS